jgi:hypothetical protein
MSEPAGLERGYRRLLGCYPGRFRSEQGEEMLAVLMAGARPGQRRPGLMESMDVLHSALGMRLRSVTAGLRSQEWVDALAVFSVAAPLFLLAADVLEVALPYRLPAARQFPVLRHLLARHPEVGGVSLLQGHFFDIAVGCQVIIAVLILLGLRWLALAAIAGCAGYLAVASQLIDWIPRPLQLLTAGAYILTAAALFGPADPRRGRQLLTWGHAVVLLLAAGAVQASTLRYDATAGMIGFLSRGAAQTTLYFVISAVLAVAALMVAVILRLNRYFLLLLAVMFYPYVMQLAYPASSSSGDLLGHPTPGHLTLLFLPPVLAAVVATLTAITRRSAPLPSEPGEPGVA